MAPPSPSSAAFASSFVPVTKSYLTSTKQFCPTHSIHVSHCAKRESSMNNNNQRTIQAVMEQNKSASEKSQGSQEQFNAESLIRQELLDMSAYTPIVPYDVLASRLGRDPSTIVKLDANENPYGPSPSVRSIISSSPYLNIYPDPESLALRKAISTYTSVPYEYILAGAGADELIDLLFRLFVTPGTNDSIINCPPTFGMYKFDANVNGANIYNINRTKDTFNINIDEIENLFTELKDNPPKMIFIASPNNPDGSILSDDDLYRLLKLPTLVIVDEAYFEFTNQDRFSLVPKYPNLIVLRTFSKWAGLAGLRLGYGAFPLNVIKHLWKIKQPYNVSVTSQLAGIMSIQEKDDLLNKVDKMIYQRSQFYERVKHLDWLKPYPSQSNYVLCRVSNGRLAEQVKNQLQDEGILIRYYTTPGLSDCIRISMGTEEQMEKLYQVLDQL